MATVAEQLRQAREAAGFTLEKVADLTKMRADRVRAVEEGNYDVFTAPVYIRGFVRTYARLVHADEAAVMAALDAELAQTERFRDHPSLTGENKGALDQAMLMLSRINWRLALPVAVVVIVVVTATWIYRATERARAADPLGGVQPGVYQSTNRTGGDTLPLPPAPSR
jgi:cytoskeletal protein RodZ